MKDIDSIYEACDGLPYSVCEAMVAEQLRRDDDVEIGPRVKRGTRKPAPVPSTAAKKNVLAAYGSRCVYCGSDEEIALDFLVPPCRNGDARHENLVPACTRCRADRGTKHLDVWFKLRLDLDKNGIYARIGYATWRLRHPGETLRRAA